MAERRGKGTQRAFGKTPRRGFIHSGRRSAGAQLAVVHPAYMRLRLCAYESTT